jgi:hypothetical protein
MGSCRNDTLKIALAKKAMPMRKMDALQRRNDFNCLKIFASFAIHNKRQKRIFKSSFTASSIV